LEKEITQGIVLKENVFESIKQAIFIMISHKSFFVQLTYTGLGKIKEVNEIPISANCVVCIVVGILEDVTFWTGEVDIVQLKD
jgi:hypothetical protein